MTVGTGIGGQVGFAEESTYGTAVTVTKFVEVDEWTMKKVPNWMRSSGVRAGQLMQRSEDALIGTADVSGGLVMDLTAKNVAMLFEHALGGTAVTTGAGPYTHTMSPGDKLGKSLTMQGGLPDVGGTVRPFTASGVKVQGFELSWSRDEWLKLTLDLLGKDLVTATALATASYTSSNPAYGWPHVTVTIGGADFVAQTGTVRYNQPLTTRFPGGQATTEEPLQGSQVEATLELTGWFEDLTHYARVIDGSEAAVVVTVERGTNSVTIDGNARFMDGQPELSGFDVIEQPLTAEFTATAGDSTGFEVVVVSDESTP